MGKKNMGKQAVSRSVTDISVLLFVSFFCGTLVLKSPLPFNLTVSRLLSHLPPHSNSLQACSEHKGFND